MAKYWPLVEDVASDFTWGFMANYHPLWVHGVKQVWGWGRAGQGYQVLDAVQLCAFSPTPPHSPFVPPQLHC